MTRESTDSDGERRPQNAIQEIHATYNRSVLGLALQLFNAIGMAIVMMIIFYSAEWKGGVDADRQVFRDFIEKGDRFSLNQGTKLEQRVITHEREHDQDIKELRQEWISELRLIRKDIKDATNHKH